MPHLPHLPHLPHTRRTPTLTPPPLCLRVLAYVLAYLRAHVGACVLLAGARRLHTLVERLMEDLSFTATDRAGEKITMTEEDVEKAIGGMLGKTDLSRFIL